jgi:hypothetical protein
MTFSRLFSLIIIFLLLPVKAEPLNAVMKTKMQAMEATYILDYSMEYQYCGQ